MFIVTHKLLADSRWRRAALHWGGADGGGAVFIVQSSPSEFLRISTTLRRAVCPRAAAARPPRKDFYLKMGQSGCSEEEIGQSMERLAAAVERMNTALAAAGPWL